MEIRKIPLEQLNPAPYNPRKDLRPGDAEYQKLKKSIEEFGYVEPVVWNSRTGNIVGGHQRFKVLADIGITEIDCVVVDMDAQDEKTLNIALNRISGEWDEDKLAELLEELQAEVDITLTGFDQDEIERLIGSISFHVGSEDEQGDLCRIEEKAGKSVKCPKCGEVFET